MQTLITDTHLLALDIHDLLSKQGGCTLNLDTGEQPTTGYAVSFPAAEEVFDHAPTVGDIRRWLRTTCEPAAAIANGRGWTVHAGAWKDQKTGRTYLDATVVIEDRQDAIDAGREWKQLAVFDLAKREEIRLSYGPGPVLRIAA
jgi:hypothetical protein